MHIHENLKGSITCGDEPEASKFEALLEISENKKITIEKLAELLIIHEGFKFELKIYE